MNKLNGKITTSATMRGALTRGAGGGTYVEANPEGEATDTLEKLMIEDTIYNVRNVPDVSSADNGDVLTKTANGAEWSPLPETGVIYSTNEQEIGRWIDGKIIYVKTFHATNLGRVSDWTELFDLQADRIIKMESSYIMANNQKGCEDCDIIRFAYNSPNKPNKIVYYSTLTQGINEIYLTVYYTKAGD